MDRTYRGLGFDPAPGEPDAVTRTVAALTEAADALAGVPPGLRRAGELSQDWHGNAADAFRARLRTVPSGLDSRERSLRRSAELLERWADVLAANRRHAEELDQRAVRLRKRIEAAMDDLQDRRDAADLAATPSAAAGANAELVAVTDRLTALDSDLTEVLAEARRLERDHLRTADGFADELAEGAGIPHQARPAAPFAVLAGEVLGTSSRVSSTLAGLLLPAAAGATPASAAGTLAAAIRATPR